MRRCGFLNNSIGRKMLIPMSLLLIIQTVLFSSIIMGGGATRQLNKNAMDILNERVINRKNYLQTEMTNRWSKVNGTVDRINTMVDSILLDENVTIDDLGKNKKIIDHILDTVSTEMIYMLQKNTVTGSFIILDAESNNQKGVKNQKWGLYIQDMEPSTETDDSSDLLIKRSPSKLPQKLDIAMDGSWSSKFIFENGNKNANNDFYYKPLNAAQKDLSMESKDLAYWSDVFVLDEEDGPIITYSLPLKNNNNQVYGVLGIEITMDYLKKLIPPKELSTNNSAAYMIGICDNKNMEFTTITGCGGIYQQNTSLKKGIKFLEDPIYKQIYQVNGSDKNKKKIYGDVQYFNLYNSNTPFESQRWALIGLEEKSQLFRFSKNLSHTIVIALFITLIAGIFCVLLISRVFTKPIITLADHVRKSNPLLPVKFNKTNMKEIDELSLSIETLGNDVAESSSKLTKIIELTNLSLVAYEIKKDGDEVFITNGFFHILGIDSEQKGNFVQIEEFNLLMGNLKSLEEKEINENKINEKEKVYRIMMPNKESKWVRIQEIQENNRTLGVILDITRDMIDLKKIEYERDNDVLTNLLNRRGFHGNLTELFKKPSNLKEAAMIMIDTDNLKYINDTYGHDFGDNYIRCTADILKKYMPAHSIISRMSGDEFYIFVYGYDKKEDIRVIVKDFKLKIWKTIFPVFNDNNFRIRVSGGIAWYKDHSYDYVELMKYADFAMYTVKKTVKGEINEFDMEDYQKNSYLLHKAEELNKFIEDKLVTFHFQPIVEVRTGNVYSYEALMRSKIETLSTPMEILALAKAQSKLNQIEQLTWFEALKAFDSMDEDFGETKIFINSIASQTLSLKDVTYLEEHYEKYLDRVVIEITEEEQRNEEFDDFKKLCARRWNAGIALDDFGTGYNGEAALLALTPQYIKIDMSIVRNIDKDENRQKLLGNVISYSKERQIKIIAEGVENKNEMTTLIESGVDYLQGYYLGMPSSKPQLLNPEIHQEIINIFNKV